jgi:hypothetical protein
MLGAIVLAGLFIVLTIFAALERSESISDLNKNHR